MSRREEAPGISDALLEALKLVHCPAASLRCAELLAPSTDDYSRYFGIDSESLSNLGCIGDGQGRRRDGW